jgi:hypothetical protein
MLNDDDKRTGSVGFARDQVDAIDDAFNLIRDLLA